MYYLHKAQLEVTSSSPVESFRTIYPILLGFELLIGFPLFRATPTMHFIVLTQHHKFSHFIILGTIFRHIMNLLMVQTFFVLLQVASLYPTEYKMLISTR